MYDTKTWSGTNHELAVLGVSFAHAPISLNSFANLYTCDMRQFLTTLMPSSHLRRKRRNRDRNLKRKTIAHVLFQEHSFQFSSLVLFHTVRAKCTYTINKVFGHIKINQSVEKFHMINSSSKFLRKAKK